MIRHLLMVLTLVCCWLALPSPAAAGPSGTSGSASFDTRSGGKAKGSGSGYDWPEMVYGGNAIQAQLPLQFGMVGYLPKARFAFQYDRQLRRQHWLHGGIALLFDRGDWENFRMDDCGLQTAMGACEKGGVVGFDLYVGYAYKFFLQKRPWLVPIVRGNFGYSYFALPRVGGGDSNREQTRTRTQALSVRPGGGIRVFLLADLAVGADINLPIGVLIHRDVPPAPAEKDTEAGFLLGIEVLPLIVEYRF